LNGVVFHYLRLTSERDIRHFHRGPVHVESEGIGEAEDGLLCAGSGALPIEAGAVEFVNSVWRNSCLEEMRVHVACEDESSIAVREAREQLPNNVVAVMGCSIHVGIIAHAPKAIEKVRIPSYPNRAAQGTVSEAELVIDRHIRYVLVDRKPGICREPCPGPEEKEIG